METIIIESNNKEIMKLFFDLAKHTGVKINKISKKEAIEFTTGLRLKKERTGVRVSKSKVLDALKKKQE